MGLRKIIAQLQIYRGAAACSIAAGGYAGAALASPAEEGTHYTLIAMVAGYLATVLFKNTLVDCNEVRESAKASYMPALTDKRTERLARLCSVVDGFEESYKLDEAVFKRIEKVYRICGMGGIVRKEFFTPFAKNWAEATGRTTEYENAAKLIGE